MKGRPASIVILVLLISVLESISLLAGPTGAVRRILRRATGQVDVVSLEDYVAAVLPVEMGPAPASALEAQAIATRSYAIARTRRHGDDGADLCDRTHCQVYGGPGGATPASTRAARATEGLVLMQEGRVIAAPFHAACGGHTARPSDVWDDEEIPDITSVEDDACLGQAGWTYRLPRADVPSLGKAFGIPDARFLEVFGHNVDGRIAMLRLVAPGGRSRVLSGFAFRQTALRMWGTRSVQSTAFELSENHSDYVLVGRGHGHGAGLCQRGAIIRSRRGETRDEILALYYKGATVRALPALTAAR
ncbi:MAG: SpoIID/LytB domain-containing protein [Thermoanaerobaculia bacterium]